MNKLKEILDFIKEKLENKKTRAITILILYFIFFVILGAMININKNNSYEEDEKINIDYNNLKNDYSYIYEVDINDNNYLVEGSYINNENTNTIKKLVDEEYIIIDNYELINKELLYIETILKVIENKDYEYETIFRNGNRLEHYKVLIKEFDNTYINDTDYIDIDITMLDEFITEIKFDASKLDNFINEDIKTSNYILKYTKRDKN